MNKKDQLSLLEILQVFIVQVSYQKAYGKLEKARKFEHLKKLENLKENFEKEIIKKRK